MRHAQDDKQGKEGAILAFFNDQPTDRDGRRLTNGNAKESLKERTPPASLFPWPDLRATRGNWIYAL